MDIDLIGKKENKTLQRQELVFNAKEAKITPSRKELLPKIAAMAGAKENLTVIKSIMHAFGEKSATIKANVYENENALKKAELRHLLERGTGKKKEEAKKEAAPKAVEKKEAGAKQAEKK